MNNNTNTENQISCTCSSTGSIEAKVPHKGNSEAIGFDLYFTGIWKQVDEVTFFETGVAIEPPPGMYFIVVPRSSLSKTCFSLANSIGIIDPDYRGTIKVALRCHDSSSKYCALDFNIAYVQLIPQLNLSKGIEFVKVNTLSTTSRGDGGFGSTNLSKK